MLTLLLADRCCFVNSPRISDIMTIVVRPSLLTVDERERQRHLITLPSSLFTHAGQDCQLHKLTEAGRRFIITGRYVQYMCSITKTLLATYMPLFLYASLVGCPLASSRCETTPEVSGQQVLILTFVEVFDNSLRYGLRVIATPYHVLSTPLFLYCLHNLSFSGQQVPAIHISFLPW